MTVPSTLNFYPDQKKKKKRTRYIALRDIPSREAICRCLPPYGDNQLMRISGLIYIRSITGGGQQRGSKNILRGRRTSLQQRQLRLRSYGVSAAHGDGQTLLPISNNNNNNNSSSSNNQSIALRHVNNNPQQYSSTSETQSRRVFPSTSTSITSTSTSTTTVISNSYSHDPHNQQQGMRTIRLVAKPRVTR